MRHSINLIFLQISIFNKFYHHLLVQFIFLMRISFKTCPLPSMKSKSVRISRAFGQLSLPTKLLILIQLFSCMIIQSHSGGNLSAASLQYHFEEEDLASIKPDKQLGSSTKTTPDPYEWATASRIPLSFEPSRPNKGSTQQSSSNTSNDVFSTLKIKFLDKPTQIDAQYLNFQMQANSLFYVNLWVGSQSQKMKMLLDTTSSWVMIGLNTCQNCVNQTTFDPTQSSTFANYTPPDYLVNELKQTSYVSGYIASDQLSLIKGSLDFFVSSFKFVGYSYQSGYSGIDGVIGLSREYVSITKSTGPLFIRDLMRAKSIFSTIFALKLDETQGSSFLDLGSYKDDPTKPIQWSNKMPYSQFWQSTVNAIQLGKNGNVSYDGNVTWNFTGYNISHTAIYSSSHSNLVLPKKIYDNLMFFILSGKESYQVDDYVISSCNLTKYNSIYLRMGETWYEIKPSTYVLQSATYQVQNSNNELKTFCTISIVSSEFDYIILGVPFMKNYYMIFDLDQRQSQRRNITEINFVLMMPKVSSTSKREWPYKSPHSGFPSKVLKLEAIQP